MLRIGNAEEIESQGENLALALVEKQRPSGDLFPRDLLRVPLGGTEEVPEELEHRQQGKCLTVWNPVRLEEGIARTSGLVDVTRRHQTEDVAAGRGTLEPYFHHLKIVFFDEPTAGVDPGLPTSDLCDQLELHVES